MNVGRDDYELDGRKPGRIDDLSIENVFGVSEQSRRQEHSRRHIASVLGAQLVEALALNSDLQLIVVEPNTKKVGEYRERWAKADRSGLRHCFR